MCPLLAVDVRLFLLFAFTEPTPLGGASDCAAIRANIERARQAAFEPWGHHRPADYDVCEIFSVDLDRPEFGLTYETHWTGGRWLSRPDEVT